MVAFLLVDSFVTETGAAIAVTRSGEYRVLHVTFGAHAVAVRLDADEAARLVAMLREES